MHGNALRLFWATAFPYSDFCCRTPDIAEVGIIFNVVIYDVDALRVISKSQINIICVDFCCDFICKPGFFLCIKIL